MSERQAMLAEKLQAHREAFLERQMQLATDPEAAAAARAMAVKRMSPEVAANVRRVHTGAFSPAAVKEQRVQSAAQLRTRLDSAALLRRQVSTDVIA